jgi:hypothetical protein
VRLLLSFALIAAALSHSVTARAESLGTLRLPDNIASLPDEAPIDILNPPAASTAWAKPGHRPLGVTLSNYDLTAEQIEAVRQTGMGLARLYIPMEKFLTAEDADWATLDQVISRLQRADLEVLAVLDSASPVSESYQRQFYRDFCKRVAQRYRESLRYYQLLDDINYKLGLSSRNYADLLAVCRPEIKGADKDAVIIAGGIRGCDITFLDMLETQRGLSNLDVIALTLMPQPDGIENRSRLARADHSLPLVGDVVNWAQQRGKKVWVTSLGVSTDSTWVGVDQVSQGCMYARGALILGTLGVERILYAQLQDNDPSYQIPARCCGLLSVDGEQKASYHILRSLAGVVRGAYHAYVPFNYSGQTYQRPAEADIHGARLEQIEASRRVFTGQPLLQDAWAISNPLDTFRTHGIEVFAYWFYSPERQEYRLIYWLTHEQTYPALITLVCENGRLLPFAEHLTPNSAFQMLNGNREQPDFGSAKNMVMLYYMPLDTVPSVVSFKANADTRPQRAELEPKPNPTVGQAAPNPDVASFRR